MKNLIKRILEHENIPYQTIIKSNSGFTNIVYFVDEKYVIKVVNTQTRPEKLDRLMNINIMIGLKNN
jgi:hypothetical protein